MIYFPHKEPVVALCLAILCLFAVAACGPANEGRSPVSADRPGEKAAWSPPAASQIRGEEVMKQ